jgi:hypothetical protein
MNDNERSLYVIHVTMSTSPRVKSNGQWHLKLNECILLMFLEMGVSLYSHYASWGGIETVIRSRFWGLVALHCVSCVIHVTIISFLVFESVVLSVSRKKSRGSHICIVIHDKLISGKVKLFLCFNWAPRHEGVLGSGGIATLTRWPRH